MFTILMLIVALIGVAGDVLTTKLVIDNGGHELNTLLADLMAKIGMFQALLVTHIPFAIILIGLNIAFPAVCWLANTLVAVGFIFLTVHNYLQYKNPK
jgi:hypothetical protein